MAPSLLLPSHPFPSRSFPPPPLTEVDWTKLDFSFKQTNGHIESRYSTSTGIWSSPKLVKDPMIPVHAMSPGLNYGQQIFEGIKAYRDPKGQIQVFRLDRHAERMGRSADFVSIPQIPTAHFKHCVHLAISLNAEWVPPHESGAAMYIRPLCFGVSHQIALAPADEYVFVVAVQPFGTYHGLAPLPCVILEEFDRTAPMGTGSAKLGGNYAPVMRWAMKASKGGFPLTLHLDSRTRTEIDEFSTSGFIGIREEAGGQVCLVVPDSANIIESVTSRSCAELAKSWGWRLEMRKIPFTELPSFTEVIAAGTAASLVAVSSITCRSSGDCFTYMESADETPKYCNMLRQNLHAIQRGQASDPFGWLEAVAWMEIQEE